MPCRMPRLVNVWAARVRNWEIFIYVQMKSSCENKEMNKGERRQKEHHGDENDK